MSANGSRIATPNLPTLDSAEEVLAHLEGSLGRISIAALTTLLANSDAMQIALENQASGQPSVLDENGKLRISALPDATVPIVPLNADTEIAANFNGSVVVASAALAMTLLAAADVTSGFSFWVLAEGGDVVISPPEGEAIGTAPSVTLNQGDWACLFCDGAAWRIIQHKAASSLAAEGLPASKRIVGLSKHRGGGGAARSAVALTADGGAVILGSALDGRSGQGSFNLQRLARPTRLLLNEPPAGQAMGHVSANGSHWLWFTSGEVFFWGRNEDGEGGLGHTNRVYMPTRITALDGHQIVDVSVGTSHGSRVHALYKSATGRGFASGYNFFGQCGIDGAPTGANARITTPEEILPGMVWSELHAVGSEWAFSAGIDDQGHLRMWGLGRALGTGDMNNRHVPTLIDAFGGHAVVKFSGAVADDTRAGIQWGARSCVLTESGEAYFCGDQDSGQGGIGSTAYIDVFRRIDDLGNDNADILTVGGHYGATFVVKNAGPLVSAGNNVAKAAVRGDDADTTVFGQVLGLDPSPILKMVAYGGWHDRHSLATLHANGRVCTGGSGINGRLGHGTDANSGTMKPVPLPAGAKVVDISCHGQHDEACLSVMTEDGRWLIAGHGGDCQNGDPDAHSRGVLTEVIL